MALRIFRLQDDSSTVNGAARGTKRGFSFSPAPKHDAMLRCLLSKPLLSQRRHVRFGAFGPLLGLPAFCVSAVLPFTRQLDWRPIAAWCRSRWRRTALLTGGVMGFLGVVGFSASGATQLPPLGPRLQFEVPEPLAIAPPIVLAIATPLPTDVKALDDDQFALAVETDIGQVGSLSIGLANRGFLFNAVPMPEGPRWHIVEPQRAFGTRTTVESLVHAIDAVNELYPDTHPLSVGHLSNEVGGYLRPHRSHQSGRDVDLGFYYRDESRWYKRATSENFDVVRNWALLSALMKTSPVEYVFIDHSLHDPLREQALTVGESPQFVSLAFDGIPGKTQPLIRHARGHDDHMHVRFASTLALENTQRLRSAFGKKAYNNRSFIAMLRTRSAKQKKALAKADHPLR